MEGGFGGAPKHPQFGYAGPMQTYPDKQGKSIDRTPEGPMWFYTYVPADAPVEGEVLYDNGAGVAFNDTYNGVFEVDLVVDTEAEYDGVLDAEGLL